MAKDSIHAQCLMTTETDNGSAICFRSKGHKPEVGHFDHDLDYRWGGITIMLPLDILKALLVDLEVAGLPSLYTDDRTDEAIEILKTARDARKGV